MQNTNNHDERDDLEIGDDLEITLVTNRSSGGGRWIRGTIMGHRFDALVFAEHAESSDYELDESRISKLWVQRSADQATVANFDRGWDVRPTDALALRIVDFLTTGLADFAFASEADE